MNLERRILKESFGILILASILSSIGGIGLETIQEKIFLILPLLILLPALNGMVGNFGIIFSSRYTTLLYQKKLGKTKFINKALKKHFILVLLISIICAFYISTLSFAVSFLKGFEIEPLLYLKILIITILSAIILIFIIAAMTIIAGNYSIRKKEDPDNLLVPLTTSIADLGSMIIFSLLVYFIL
ncbi:magnesium transporter [Candidatus Woesearchaeota archaeon]|nr:magnesium transporter [Candidatus Woesearchaeota archaeon]